LHLLEKDAAKQIEQIAVQIRAIRICIFMLTSRMDGSKAKQLEQTGARIVLIASNTLHKVAAQVQATINVPLSHIADAVGREVQQAGITCVGVLGTRFVMEQDFYSERLIASGLAFFFAADYARGAIHEIIYKELSVGIRGKHK